MKIFKPKTILIVALSVVMVLFASCVKQMEGLDKELKGVSSQDLTIDANEGSVLLPGMMTNIRSGSAGTYQSQQNHSGDVFGGYMATATPFSGNINSYTYSFTRDDWMNRIWSVPSSSVLNVWLQMKKAGFDTKYPDLYGIALICKVWAACRAADSFGPIPYSKYGNSNSVPFDSEEEAYMAFFADLDQAVTLLTTAEDANPAADQVRFKKVDKSLFGGDYGKWIKAANTLKLRLAIRISNVSPEKAKIFAEEAVNQKYGVLESTDGPFSMTVAEENPLATITNSWDDIRLGAPIETYLTGFNDPRLPLYAVPAIDPAVAGQIKGIRQGIELPAKSVYVGFSRLNIKSTTPVKIMDVSESYFLRAEGVLRGWNMGGKTTQEYYEDGVRANFLENGLSASAADDYLQSTGTQIPYVDPHNAKNNSGVLSDVTVKWNDGATFQEKLEKIITQKWVAMYPEGEEAWAEFRRTGYPKQYPVVLNLSGGVIPEGEFIKRFPYPTIFTNAAPTEVSAAVSKFLGGKDSPFTPLWWDVD